MGMHKNKELKESEVETLTSLMQCVDNVSDFKRLQCVYLRSKGYNATQPKLPLLFTIRLNT